LRHTPENKQTNTTTKEHRERERERWRERKKAQSARTTNTTKGTAQENKRRGSIKKEERRETVFSIINPSRSSSSISVCASSKQIKGERGTNPSLRVCESMRVREA